MKAEPEETSGMERHLQSAIQIILVGLMAWCGESCNQTDPTEIDP